MIIRFYLETLALDIKKYMLPKYKLVNIHNEVSNMSQDKDRNSGRKNPWGQKFINIGGKTLSLNTIEHEILRKMDEPRIHVAIVCASVSCPDLRLEAFTVGKLNEQLSDQMKRFLQSSKKGMRIDKKKNKYAKFKK